MQRKIIIDTNVYIDLFNEGRRVEMVNAFVNITYLAHPVLHELWMGVKGRPEIKALKTWQDTFIRLKRLIIPNTATLVLVGLACQKMRLSGKLDPVHPKIYNDITIAALARQIGATILTKNKNDYKQIQTVFDFNFKAPV